MGEIRSPQAVNSRAGIRRGRGVMGETVTQLAFGQVIMRWKKGGGSRNKDRAEDVVKVVLPEVVMIVCG